MPGWFPGNTTCFSKVDNAPINPSITKIIEIFTRGRISVLTKTFADLTCSEKVSEDTATNWISGTVIEANVLKRLSELFCRVFIFIS